MLLELCKFSSRPTGSRCRVAGSHQLWYNSDLAAGAPAGKTSRLVAVAGFVGAGVGLLTGQDWWPTLAMVAAAVSLLAIVSWVRVVSLGAWAGVCVDLVILAASLLPWEERIVAAVR